MSSPTLDRVVDAVFRVDTKFDFKFVSESGQLWLNSVNSTTAAGNFLDLLHPDDINPFKSRVTDDPDSFACDVRIKKADGDCWVNIRGYQLPAANQYVICLIDISAWKADDGVHRYAAEHDELTGLPNRAFLKKLVDDLIKTAKHPFFVAMLDLDGFKKVNDTLGHSMGDAVLVETAKRLLKVMGPQDTLARLGGDEFVMVFCTHDAVVTKGLANDVLQAVARPYDTAPHSAYLGVSIGIAEYPTQGQTYSALLKNADTAMYQSKNAGKNRITIFSPTEDSEDFSIKSAIHKGIQEGEFFLVYQPQFDMNRKVIGAEALMRWTSRIFGTVGPDKFIPITEESGLMPFLGKWALRYACHQLKQFQQLMPEFVMSVNVSPVQFDCDDFDVMVLDAIVEAGVDPVKVVLEITESTLMQSQLKTQSALTTLREQGVRFSIDDFGTGFSSLAYLTSLPVSSIKIDKKFVTAIENEALACSTDKKLITAMISLAHSIDLKVLAEGVETEAQFAYLGASGCDYIQGYLLGKPISAQMVMALLESQMERTL